MIVTAKKVKTHSSATLLNTHALHMVGDAQAHQGALVAQLFKVKNCEPNKLNNIVSNPQWRENNVLFECSPLDNVGPFIKFYGWNIHAVMGTMIKVVGFRMLQFLCLCCCHGHGCTGSQCTATTTAIDWHIVR